MPELRERVLYPRPGWLSLGLLIVMGLAVAWSVQGAGWLDQLDFMAPVALWAVVCGAVLGLLGGSIVFILPLGAVLGTVIVLWTVGGEYFTPLSQIGRLLALRVDLIDWIEMTVRTGYPSQMAPYAIGLGLLMWSTGFMAAYVVYRYHRVLDAIVLLGAAILVNMSATFTDLFGHLLLFVIAAILLWLRASLVARQDGWQRRRVNEDLEVPSAIMRTGIVFAAGSVALAWVLTSVAIAAPLTGAWRNLDGVWTDVRDQFEGVFGNLTNPQSRITGTSFGSSFTVRGEWVSNDGEVLVLAADRPLYLRTTTYDLYTGLGWERTDGPRRSVNAGEPLFPSASSERPTVEDSVRPERIAIEMRQTVGRNLFTAGSPLEIYAPSVIHEPNGLPLIGGIEAPNPVNEGEAYEVLVLVSEATEADLAVAGTEYPQAVKDLYLDTDGITPAVTALARELSDGAENPYEMARALSRYLRGPDFTYSTSGPEVPAGGDLVDTFLFGEGAKTGYCQYYASAMALMARSLGLPARVAVGFAPGEADGDGLWLVREANAHAWVEIYFPGHGWQIFEATKSIEPRFVRAPGDAETAVPPQFQGPDPWLETDVPLDIPGRGGIDALPSPVLAPGAIDPLRPDLAAEEPSSRIGNAVVMVAAVLALVAFVLFRMRRSQRRWRLLPAADRAWNQLTAAAERAGVGPRPSETIYEYSGWLEDQLPRHGEPIRQVADGKVWQSYSGRRLSRGAADRLDDALSRLRMPMIGLAIRRGVRRLVRRDRP